MQWNGAETAPNQLSASADADHAETDDRRRVSGWAIMLVGATIDSVMIVVEVSTRASKRDCPRATKHSSTLLNILMKAEIISFHRDRRDDTHSHT